jgi:hypothetical protein
VEELHPFFVEVCRLYKLTERNGQVVCLRRSAKAPRIRPTQSDVGDIWTPIRLEDGERVPCALYETPSLYKVTQILFNAEIPASLSLQTEDGACPILQIRGVARDPSRQGMTNGYVNVEIPLPYTSEEERVRMGSRVTTWLAHVSEVQEIFQNIMITAINAEGSVGGDSHKRMARNWRVQFEHQVTDSFWSTLRETKNLEDEDALRQWQGLLAYLMKDAARKLGEMMPMTTAKRYKLVAWALNMVSGFTRTKLPLVAQEESFATNEDLWKEEPT